MGTATLTRDAMARPKGRPKTSERDDVSVKIDREVVDMARHIATQRAVSLAELLSESLRQPITEAFLGVLRELESKVRRPDPKGKPGR